jgi:hypothetical protein
MEMAYFTFLTEQKHLVLKNAFDKKYQRVFSEIYLFIYLSQS